MPKKKKKSSLTPSTIPAIYDSMANCASVTGIPLMVLKSAKKNGCPGFKASRVYLLPIIEWIFKSEDAEAFKNWSAELTKWQAQREKLKLAKEEKTVVPFTEVDFVFGQVMAALFAEMETKFFDELPPALQGLDAIAIRGVLRIAVEKFKDGLQKRLQKLHDETPENANQL